MSYSDRVWTFYTKYDNQTNFARLYYGTNLSTKVNPILPDSYLTFEGINLNQKLDVDWYSIKSKKTTWLKLRCA